MAGHVTFDARHAAVSGSRARLRLLVLSQAVKDFGGVTCAAQSHPSATGHQTFCCFVNPLTILFADLADCLSSIASNEAIMKLSSLLAFAGTLPLHAELSRRTHWRKSFALLFHALHESRRRQAARELGRHQHLLEQCGSEKPSSER
jgi:hypothetical protein